MADAAEIDLDMVGVLAGTDKSSSVQFAWDYLRHYQEWFAPWRDAPINLIEIGVSQGSSLAVWLSYFSQARIIGVDINPRCARLAGGRVEIAIGSQEDPAFLQEISAKFPPTIVIDDGSHQAHHIVYTFERLFPSLRPGGLYVVEDMAFHFGHYGDRWRGNGTVSAPDYLLGLARQFMGGTPPPATAGATERYAYQELDSVSLIHSAIMLRKKAPRDVPRALADANQYLAGREQTAEHHLRLGEYALKHGAPLAEVRHAVDAAIRIGGRQHAALTMQVDLLWRMRRFKQAAAVVREMLEMAPLDLPTWRTRLKIENQLGRTADELQALLAEAALPPAETAQLADYIRTLPPRPSAP